MPARLLVCLLALLLPGLATPSVDAHPDHGETAAANEHGTSTSSRLPGRKKHGHKGTKHGADTAAEESDEKQEKWDVDHPPGNDPYPVGIDVDEGTWMSLDVSPDGQQIVFDLLGDIYRLPITGGDAEALTAGMAWDMQPRYSPDGQQIAFTSDRGGGDNIWRMGADGSDPEAVSSEDFRLLNSPAWSPDGEWIVARKHFTSRRSLGAGEIWLYHRSGGHGMQMTEKPNEQKDLGEPAFSADGHYVYFSRDTTPGDTFQYSKDPNDEIYTIRRLDRDTGEIEPFITGPGGAVRPTPSPDGKYLAFVRRVRFRTVLFLHDLESGRNTPLYENLERDLQETWAIHGVYPTFAWTPDSRSIVFYAKGKIRRIEIASGESQVIPFRVRQTHHLLTALRFPVEVAPDQFKVKMLRWVQVSPSGDQVIFQALGRLWSRQLPDGEPQRLTDQNDHFELYPSFSRDGQQIVYVSWDDQKLGAVRIIASSGGASRSLTAEPGHYVEPVFSPNGKTVVFRKIGGGLVRSPLYSRNQGLYALATDGGEPLKVTSNGVRPHFAADSQRVYFQSFDGPKERTLRSIELDGSDERSHFQNEAVTEYRISPDGLWVAFREHFNAYVAPFVATGKAISLGPKTKNLPLRQVSRDAGEYLHWSGDSSKLYWALGPELYERQLSDAFAFLDGAPEELPEAAGSGLDIGFELATDKPSGRVAFVGARLITMRGEEIIEDGTVLVEGDRIVAVGNREEIEVPADAFVVDAAGKTLIPGLVDVHWHGRQGSAEITPEQNWLNYASLAFGVTTAHDPSNDTSTFFAAAELAKAGMITAPRLFSTGTILYGATGDFKAEINSLDDARSHLRRMQAAGAFSVKSYNQPRREQRQQVITAARELNMMVVPEGGSLFMHNMTMVVDGHTGIEHALPLERLYDDVVQLWSESGTGYTPTLVVGYGGIWGERYWYHHTKVWENERLLSFVPREIIDAASRRRVMAPEEEYNHIRIAEGCKQLSDAGVSIQLGAHGQREGLAAHWEMWMFVQGGMTPHQALRAATLNGAHYLGLDNDLGSIEPGKLADLVLLENNPLADIRSSENVLYTMLGGRLYEASSMNQIAPNKVKRAPFYWQQ